MYQYHSIAELARAAEKSGSAISAVVLADQAKRMGIPPEEILDRMRHNLRVMSEAVVDGSRADIRSTSGLSGGDGHRMLEYAQSRSPLSGQFCARAIARALAVSECNAAMGRIVAAPTAGSCGILPGALLSLLDEGLCDETGAALGLVTAGAVGMVIATEASIAGAEGGCQAECGSAAAMAAAAMVEIAGGSPAMVENACAIALKNQLGLVCDPVAGLVETPCIKRNAGGIMCALGAADMALAGITSLIPVDEVIGAMRDIGNAMPSSLRETAQGGLAVTPTGLAIKERVFGSESCGVCL